MARDVQRTQGLRFRAGLARAAAAVEAFSPDIVVIFGTDHWRAFPENVPAVAVILGADSIGDLGSPSGRYNVPSQLATHLATELLAHNVDCAVVRNGRLDHGFGQTAADILGGISRYPVLPVFVNCALPPLVTCVRAAEVGRAVGEILRSEHKVLFLASGGLSHAPPSMALSSYGLDEAERRSRHQQGAEYASRQIRPDLDEQFLELLENSDSDWISDLDRCYLPGAGEGGNEIRTWLACWAAVGGNLAKIAYQAVPEWITGMGAAGSAWAFGSTSHSPRTGHDRGIGQDPGAQGFVVAAEGRSSADIC
jgi:2,3-dihydroxyphenylpropionate 1,2-dioxygenase